MTPGGSAPKCQILLVILASWLVSRFQQLQFGRSFEQLGSAKLVNCPLRSVLGFLLATLLRALEEQNMPPPGCIFCSVRCERGDNYIAGIPTIATQPVKQKGILRLRYQLIHAAIATAKAIK